MTPADATSTVSPAAPEPALAALHPAYFALVMATGIVSIGAHILGLVAVARGLFVVNLIA